MKKKQSRRKQSYISKLKSRINLLEKIIDQFPKLEEQNQLLKKKINSLLRITGHPQKKYFSELTADRMVGNSLGFFLKTGDL